MPIMRNLSMISPAWGMGLGTARLRTGPEPRTDSSPPASWVRVAAAGAHYLQVCCRIVRSGWLAPTSDISKMLVPRLLERAWPKAQYYQ